MENNNSDDFKQPTQKGFALFELISTSLVLIAVATSCVEEYLGHSPDSLPIIKAFGVLPMNSAEILNLLIDDKNLTIGLITVFCTFCAINVFLKLFNLIYDKKTTTLISWIILLFSGILSGAFLYEMMVISVEEKKSTDAFWFGSGHTSIGGGAWLLFGATFLLFLVMTIKGMDSSVSYDKKNEQEHEAEPIKEEPVVEKHEGLDPVVENVTTKNSTDDILPAPKNNNHNQWLYPVGAIVAVILLALGGKLLYQKVFSNSLDRQKTEYDISEWEKTDDNMMEEVVTDEMTEVEPEPQKEEKGCPDESHPHAIDLGLPSGTKWYCCNYGAQTPQEEGTLIDYNEVAENNNLPTGDQADELVDHCSFKKENGGILVTGPNKKQIFFPKNHIWIPSWYEGETGLVDHPAPLLWTKSGDSPWFAVYEPGEKINGTAGNQVKYAARYVVAY